MRTGHKIPFVDLKAQYRSIKSEIDGAIARVLNGASFVLGDEVSGFEDDFAEFTGFRHAVAVANGTDAVELALRACGLQPGDEVVAPAHTFIATTEAVTRAGGRVKLADVADTTFCMTAETFERAATSATRFVIPVAIYGNPAGLEAVVASARSRGVKVVVDAAQAHGARIGDRRLGQLADVAAYSFYPGKNLGAYGDAGAVATNDGDVARRVRMWRNHGQEGKFDHEFEGVNSRMDGLQGAVLRVKLRHLDGWTEARRNVAAFYRQALHDVEGLELPLESEPARHVYHLFVIRVDDRDELRARLADQGIATGIHYPSPIHLLPAYRHLGLPRGSFPTAEGICDSILSLPMFPEMTADEVAAVRQAIDHAGVGRR